MKIVPTRRQIAQDFTILRKIPFTLIIVLTCLTAGVATKALWVSAETSDILQRFGYGLPAFKDGHFLNVLSGMLVMPAPWMYALVIPLLAIGAGFLEYRYGALRMLVTILVTHVGAVFIIAGLLYVGSGLDIAWVHDLSRVYDIGISNAAFGVAGAATAALPVLWRRRVRAGFFIYCITFLLYSSIIWDFTHFTGFLLGLAIGPWVVKRPYEFNKPEFTEQSARSYAALFLLYLIFHQIFSYAYHGNGILTYGDVDQQTGLMVTIGTATILGLFAYGLYSGRKFAWRVMVGVSAVLVLLLGAIVVAEVVLRQFSGLLTFDFVLYSLFFAMLVLYRKHFNVQPNRATRRTVYQRFVLIGLAFLALNTLIIYLLRHSFSPEPSLGRALGEASLRVFDLGNNLRPETTATLVYMNISGVLWFLFFVGCLGSLILTTYRARTDRESFEDYDKLLHEVGSSSISWMTRWKKMAYWVNPGKTAGYAYRLENNVAIVLSDPVGTRAAVAGSLTAFERSCGINGWQPVFYAVTESTKNLLGQRGYQAISVGEDTVIPLEDLAFTGKSWQSVRSSLNRARKDGITMHVIHLGSTSIGLQDQLQTIAKGWSDDKSLPEMGFTLGTLTEAADPEVRMHLAIDSEGTVHGMSSWMPVYRNGKITGWTIDIMQRRLHESAMAGVMEYLIAESALVFKQEGYECISLSAAPLSREGKANGPVERLLDTVAERMEPYYGFKSLYRFKQKFQPRHEPLYLCYKDGAQLPAIALAIGKAYMPNVSLKDLALNLIK